jgi:hypothetical protein
MQRTTGIWVRLWTRREGKTRARQAVKPLSYGYRPGGAASVALVLRLGSASARVPLPRAGPGTMTPHARDPSPPFRRVGLRFCPCNDTIIQVRQHSQVKSCC